MSRSIELSAQADRFDGVAIGAKDLEARQPAKGFQAFIDCGARWTIARTALELFAVFGTIIVYVVKAQSVEVCKSAMGAFHRTLRVVLNSIEFEFVTIPRLQHVVPVSIVDDPVFVPLRSLCLIFWAGVEALLVFSTFLFGHFSYGKRVVWHR